MKTTDVIEYFGSIYKVAQKLEVAKQSVANWGYLVPVKSAIKLNKITNGRLKIDSSMYVDVKEVEVDGIEYRSVLVLQFPALMRRIDAGQGLFFLAGESMSLVSDGEKNKMRERFRTYELFEKKAP